MPMTASRAAPASSVRRESWPAVPPGTAAISMEVMRHAHRPERHQSQLDLAARDDAGQHGAAADAEREHGQAAGRRTRFSTPKCFVAN